MLHLEAANPSNQINKSRLRELAQQIGYGLRHEFGVGASGPDQDVVTVMSYGQVMVPAVLFGIVAAGGVYSAASPSSTVTELSRQITTGKSNLIICNQDLKDVAVKAAKESGVPLSRVLILESSPGWNLYSIEGHVNVISKQKLPWERIVDPVRLKNSLIVILWSSGTTGPPKGNSPSDFGVLPF